ncbi:MAG: PEP-CTERM sorting domain-containing protein [Microcystis aeruginosa Ma_QC_Ca_00000000_S207]|uniref:PEP-CTERM sorting domain-containing protein n=1 Tax=Microcystis aeruginosa Ma_QC_Ca_00000000_S207 TaxID=2486251 RepID=A0A552F4H2_MICAE|nr:MAG: PEP-CTERM sorting domain-containing protein [Microcystis aeruginosa Ma_QC_Ca_00000000_S207]
MILAKLIDCRGGDKNRLSKLAIASSVLTFSTLAISPVQAAQLIIPNTTVLGTDVFSGPTFTVSQNFLPSDTLSVNVSGTVDLFNGEFTTNAAGVIVSPPVTHTGNNPGQVLASPGGQPHGSLLIGNNTLGFFPLFLATAANGLGNANPPTNLSLSGVPLSSIFTNVGFTGIANGTVLEFRVNDTDTYGNSGQFVIASTPEPSTILGLGLLGFGAFCQRQLSQGKKSKKED